MLSEVDKPGRSGSSPTNTLKAPADSIYPARIAAGHRNETEMTNQLDLFDRNDSNVVGLSTWKKGDLARKSKEFSGTSPIFFRPDVENVLCDGCDKEVSPNEVAYCRDQVSTLWPQYLGRYDFCSKCFDTPPIKILGRRLKAARLQSEFQNVEQLAATSSTLTERFIRNVEAGQGMWDDPQLHEKVYILMCAYNVSTWFLYHGLWELHRTNNHPADRGA